MKPLLVGYHLEDKIATVVMDDGQKNVISPAMIEAINKALDQAEKDQAVVVLTGREQVFSAGFDLKILKTGVVNTFKMLIGGFKLAERLLSFPTPVIIACNGHAIAMGAFLVLSGDYRLGVDGPFKIVTNEVAIGLTIPKAGITIARQRLAPAHFVRATLLAETYNPQSAVEAGFLDCVVPAATLLQETQSLAKQLADLDMTAHYQTKLRARRSMLRALRYAILLDRVDFIWRGIRRAFQR